MFHITNNLVKTVKLIILLSSIFVLSFIYAEAATLSVTPDTGTYTNGQTFTVIVRAVPGGDNVNAVESTMSFDPAVLSVLSISKDGSAFSLWTTEPTFSNAAGTIEFGGGSPTPFTSTSNLLTITFRAVGEGDSPVDFTEASVLAADGLGTDVYEGGATGSFTIGAASEATPDPTPTTEPVSNDDDDEEAIIFGDPPRPPEIGSQTFLDPEVWYNETKGVFAWTLPFDVTTVAVEITDDPENVPQDNEEAVLEPPTEEFVITDGMLRDGVQYISINFENQVDWGAVTNRKIQIDTTPPEPFSINVQAGTAETAFPLIRFEAEDTTSGIEYYDMTVADKEPVRITPDEARLGYLLKELEDGTYTVKVIATDLAGNEREGSVAVLITAGWIKPSEIVEETSFWDFLTPLNFFIFFLLVVITLQFIYFWYDHKRNKERDEKLRRETREIQDQMEKIFSALRDEIYDQVTNITKRKRLSQKEKDAVEGLTQALEVSETLIEKEINDVKTILK